MLVVCNLYEKCCYKSVISYKFKPPGPFWHKRKNYYCNRKTMPFLRFLSDNVSVFNITLKNISLFYLFSEVRINISFIGVTDRDLFSLNFCYYFPFSLYKQILLNL